MIGGSRRRQAPSFLFFFFFFRSFAYQYHRPSGTVKYRHDEVERERERNTTSFFFLLFETFSSEYINRNLKYKKDGKDGWGGKKFGWWEES